MEKQNNKFKMKDVITMILETKRLYLREMNQDDFDSLCKILQDEEVMYAYEGAFQDAEVKEWLDPVSYTHLDVYKRQLSCG